MHILLREVSDHLANLIDQYTLTNRLRGGRPTAVIKILEETLAGPKSTNATLVANRLNRIVDDLIKLGTIPMNPKLSIPRIAEMLGFSTVGPFEDMLAAKNEPTFAFLEQFGTTFGVNVNWLKDGRNYPYTPTEHEVDEPLEILDYVLDRNLGSDSILYAVNVANVQGNTLFVLTTDHLRYTILSSTRYHLSASESATDMRHRGEIARLTAVFWYAGILQGQKLPSLHGCRIDESEYRALLSGDVHLGLILGDRRNHSLWTEHFHDFYRPLNYWPLLKIAQKNAKSAILGFEQNPTKRLFEDSASLEKYWKAQVKVLVNKPHHHISHVAHIRGIDDAGAYILKEV
jgi:hypothetical protein